LIIILNFRLIFKNFIVNEIIKKSIHIVLFYSKNHRTKN